MELKQLEAFVSVAELKSFSGAAKELYLTQPTVSTHIASLENELGVKLFERTTKSLKLSEEGTRILPFAVRMTELKKAILSECAVETEPNINIGASTIPATYLLPSVLAEFAKRYPDVKYKIVQGNSSEIEERVLDGSVQFAIVGHEPLSDGITSDFLCDDALVLVTPVNEYYTALKAQNPDISRLLEEPLILREDGSGTQQFVDKVLAYVASAKGLNIPVRSNNQEAIKRMVVEGVGVSIMSVYAAAELETRKMAYCYPVDISENRHFYIIYRKDKVLAENAKRMISLAHSFYQ